MTDQHVIEAEAVEEAAGVALEHRPASQEVLRPLDADALVDSFQAYQDLLPKLLTAEDYQKAGRDENGNDRHFVKKSGWRKIATAFNLNVEIIHDEVERDANGQAIRARVVARATAPQTGRYMDGDGYCALDEKRFRDEKARTKVENDLRATAATRAKNRAIADLVGMGAISAEENEGNPPNVEEASLELKTTTRNALTYLAGGDPKATADAWDALARQWEGYLPAIAGQAITIAATAIKRADQAAAEQGALEVDATLEEDA